MGICFLNVNLAYREESCDAILLVDLNAWYNVYNELDIEQAFGVTNFLFGISLWI